jgi:hypothetical protein
MPGVLAVLTFLTLVQDPEYSPNPALKFFTALEEAIHAGNDRSYRMPISALPKSQNTPYPACSGPSSKTAGSSRWTRSDWSGRPGACSVTFATVGNPDLSEGAGVYSRLGPC